MSIWVGQPDLPEVRYRPGTARCASCSGQPGTVDVSYLGFEAGTSCSTRPGTKMSQTRRLCVPRRITHLGPAPRRPPAFAHSLETLNLIPSPSPVAPTSCSLVTDEISPLPPTATGDGYQRRLVWTLYSPHLLLISSLIIFPSSHLNPNRVIPILGS